MPVPAASLLPDERLVRDGFALADDDMPIYWRAVGRGPVIACCNGVGVSTFFWKYLVAAFSDRYTVVVWDYRGHGRSGRMLDPLTADLSIARHADDLASVLAHADPGGGSAVLVGHSMGCQVALETRRRHPETVRALVLALGTAGRTLETFFDNPRMPELVSRLHRLVFRIGPRTDKFIRPVLASPLAWDTAVRFHLVDPYYTRREDMLPYMEHLATLDPRIFLESVIQAHQHDGWDLLPVLDRPLLVIAAEKDTFTPLWCSRRIAELTPGAEILILADASHAALIEQPETINHRIERFLRERVAHSPS